jgi:hypothetical protein
MSRIGRVLLLLFAVGAFLGHDYVVSATWLTAYAATRVYPLVRQMFDL